MNPRPSRFSFLALLLVLALFGTAQCAPPQSDREGPDRNELAAPLHGLRVVSTLPHDPAAFTQGLFAHGGVLYESTGQYGSSGVRMVDIQTGRILQRRSLEDALFGEGLARAGDTAVQLTWKEGVGLIYELGTLEKLKTFNYEGEGWGLASACDAENGKSGLNLVMSDGSDELTFLDAKTLQPTRRIKVRDGETAVKRLNELEWYHGLLLANVWLSDLVAAIDPDTGTVAAWIDLSPLRERLSTNSGAANGMAYDAASDRLYVTGKNWNRLFQIEIVPPLEQ